jgi:hypothetical protein
MQAEFSSGQEIVYRSFFGEELYPPLITKEKRNCCISLPSWKCIKISGGIVGFTIGGALTYIAADCMRVMIETPPSSDDFIYNATLLGLETLLAGGAACVGLVACCFFRWRKKKMTDRLAHFPQYQGSLITPWIYRFRNLSLKDEELCISFIHNCFNELEQKKLFEPWLKCKKFETREEASQFMYNRLNKGTCYGHSMALLAMMRTDYDAASKNLMDKLELQKIVYFQFMVEILIDLMNHNGWDDLFNAFPVQKKLGMKYSENTESITSYTFWLLALLNLGSRKILFYESNYASVATMDSTALEEFFRDPFAKMDEMQNTNRSKSAKGLTIAGIITLREDGEPEIGEDGDDKRVAHALFFQFSEKHYRFHDSGCSLPGFFEFNTKDQFFENLMNHVKSWPQFKNGSLRVTVLGIPQEESGEDASEEV